MFAHTPDTAHNISVASDATPYRVLNLNSNSRLESPFNWGAMPMPPKSTDDTNVLISEPGQDIFIETDCTKEGSCFDGAGDESHLMVYSDKCRGGWFNTVTGACRNNTAGYVDLQDLKARVEALEAAQ